MRRFSDNFGFRNVVTLQPPYTWFDGEHSLTQHTHSNKATRTVQSEPFALTSGLHRNVLVPCFKPNGVSVHRHLTDKVKID